MKTQKSSLIAKLKSKTKGKWDKSKGKAPVARGSSLPGGIVNGVGQITAAKLAESQDGVPTASITITCIHPEEYRGVNGRSSYRFADSDYKSIQQVLDNFSSDLQLCGVNVDDVSEDDFDDVLKELAAEKPKVYFNTVAWEVGKGNNKRSGVSLLIQGLYDEEDGEGTEEEEEESEDTDTDTQEEEKPKRTRAKKTEEVEEEEEETEEDDDYDLVPAVGEMWNYKPQGKKSPVSCQVVKILASKRLCDLKYNSTVYKGVSWDDIEFVEEEE